eukprot:225495-Rhodomonas_salina.1
MLIDTSLVQTVLWCRLLVFDFAVCLSTPHTQTYKAKVLVHIVPIWLFYSTPSVPAYVPATPCPVLTARMVVPGPSHLRMGL